MPVELVLASLHDVTQEARLEAQIANQPFWGRKDKRHPRACCQDMTILLREDPAGPSHSLSPVPQAEPQHLAQHCCWNTGLLVSHPSSPNSDVNCS